MQYKSEKQKEALQKQAKYLQQINKLFSVEQENDIKNLYIAGLSCNEIAKKLNCSKTPILRIIKDLPKRKASEYSSHKSKNQFGENNPSWKGGIKSVYDRVRGLTSYWTWHHAILDRDNHTCQNCGNKEELQVHHMKTLKFLIQEYCKNNSILVKDLTEKDLNSDFFYELSNGITFCKKCHRDWHKINGRVIYASFN